MQKDADCCTWPCLLATTLPRTPIPPMASGKGKDREMRRSQFSTLVDTAREETEPDNATEVVVDDVSGICDKEEEEVEEEEDEETSSRSSAARRASRSALSPAAM